MRYLGALLAVSVSIAVAQEFRATISGEVTDPSGAAVDGAKVTAISLERNVLYDATSNSAGRYNIPFLLPGQYTIAAEKAGFKKQVITDIFLEVAQTQNVPAVLHVGAVAESVEVRASTDFGLAFHGA